jgi:hypothetical protein
MKNRNKVDVITDDVIKNKNGNFCQFKNIQMIQMFLDAGIFSGFFFFSQVALLKLSICVFR